MVTEFALVFMIQMERWYVLLDCGTAFYGGGTVGAALNAALRQIGAAEADFEPMENSGCLYRYVRSEEGYVRGWKR